MDCKKTLTMEFGYDQHGEAHLRRVLGANAAYAALWDIGQEVFRPAREHGYSDQEIQGQLDKAGDAGLKLVSLLEKKFYEILEEHRVSMEDWS